MTNAPALPRHDAQNPRFTMDQVRAQGLVVIGEDVFDIRRFAPLHPGGDFLRSILGTDATKQLQLAHGKNERVLRMMKRFRVGALICSTRPAEDRRLLALEEELRAEGLFAPRPGWLLRDLLGILLPFAAALLCARWCAPLALLLLCVAVLNQTFFAHDARHDAVLPQERAARRLVDGLGALVLGTTLNPLADEHRRHHAFTNCLGHDDSLSVAGMVWHRRQLRGKGRLWLRLQLAVWMLGVLPLTFPYMLLSGLAYLTRRRQHLLLLGIALRWLLLGCWFHSAWLLLLPQLLVSSFQALLSSLNHLHLEIAPGPSATYARTMILRTQNTNTGALWTWLCGALNFHIEHHLFPDMPRRNYPRVAARVARFCADLGLPYQRSSVWSVFGWLVRKLRHPLAARTPAGLPAPGYRAVKEVTDWH